MREYRLPPHAVCLQCGKPLTPTNFIHIEIDNSNINELWCRRCLKGALARRVHEGQA